MRCCVSCVLYVLNVALLFTMFAAVIVVRCALFLAALFLPAFPPLFECLAPFLFLECAGARLGGRRAGDSGCPVTLLV
jgi:hypothetical protein